MEQTIQANENQPATKGDLRHVEARIDKRLDALHEDMREIRRVLFHALIGGIIIFGGVMTAVIAALLK